MKFFIALFYTLVFSLTLLAQTNTEILATISGGQKITVAELPPDLREAYKQRNTKTAQMRQQILTQMIVETLLESEAAARRIDVEKLSEEIRTKAAAPTEAQIKAVYNTNKTKIGDRSLEEMREQIVAFLRRENEQKALVTFIKRLQAKYKVTPGKPLNAPNLKAADALFTVGAKRITVAQFEQRARRELYDFRAEIYDAVVNALEEMIYAKLVATEAQKAGIDSGDLIAREVTDKMRDFSNEESENLREDFRRRLFRQYNAQILVKEPEPFAQNISIETDDPARGDATAPVTVVMFSDFQCSACAATHPVLQRVLAEYGDKIRFVVRDFPLTTIHKDAFLAAQAANAAHAQGKFFEYTEILYRNQDALDAASLRKYAADSGLNVGQFELDLQSGKFAGEVRRDMAEGKNYGVGATPTVFVNGVKVRGLSAKAFRDAIEKALAKTKTGAR